MSGVWGRVLVVRVVYRARHSGEGRTKVFFEVRKRNYKQRKGLVERKTKPLSCHSLGVFLACLYDGVSKEQR